ncbi:GNAT family N-acetyltransferase [Actinophytocola algeriensis]|uniref:RimJ/RimL family protein N-acetyltransferase n=1 Tax=Actinophytocola algeriensis TaxID=1768010 RepID=A0A7W7Q8H0_9PSEU|nr:GNAT family N-acetyltransferase [Actinophytocola algeriensis]MBB4909002.1 RimJ/RimL family protein N-acetyltransferase [Actinophytocola algeriensis]MBE1474610.1 RimJ/RimL family protein N-acetyltransferase [Actinophytocola algeriensis]
MSTIRRVEERDLEALVDVMADPVINRYLARDFTDPDVVRGFVARGVLDDGPRGTGRLVVEEDGRIAGIATLRTSTKLPGGVLETGWCLAREYWGTGLAEQVARTLVDTGLELRGAVFALVAAENARARAFAARVGFFDVGGDEQDGTPHRVLVALPAVPEGVHHVELWVADLAAAQASFGWLFTELGWREYQRWERGVSWRRGASYVVVEDSPARAGDRHERTAPGINHLALHAGTRADVDRIAAAAARHGWRLMFADRHPHAGGPDHYAAYLENADGFEVELVATHP